MLYGEYFHSDYSLGYSRVGSETLDFVLMEYRNLCENKQ